MNGNMNGNFNGNIGGGQKAEPAKPIVQPFVNNVTAPMMSEMALQEEAMPPKKNKTGLVIGIVVVLVIIIGVGAFIGIKQFSGKGKDKDNESEINTNVENSNELLISSNISSKGTYVKELEGFRTVAIDTCGEYFTLEDKEDTDKISVINVDGQVVATSYKKPVCYSDGIVITRQNDESNPYAVWKNGKIIYSFYAKQSISYMDGNLYYLTDEEFVSYSLSEDKVIWKTPVQDFSYGTEPVVTNRFVLVKINGNRNSGVLDRESGKVIALPNDEYVTYGSKNDYYVKAYKAERDLINKVEVYDYNSTLISQVELDGSYLFKGMLSNGYYVVQEHKEVSVSHVYTIYDQNSKKVDEREASSYEIPDFEMRSIFKEPIGYSNDKISLVYAGDVLVVHNDGKIETMNERKCLDLDTPQQNQIFTSDVDDDYKTYLINYQTGKKIPILEEKRGYCSGAEYLFLKYDRTNYSETKFIGVTEDKVTSFYDADLNKLEYETTGFVNAIKDAWFLIDEYICDEDNTNCSLKFWAYNVETNQSFDIDVFKQLDYDFGRLESLKVNHSGFIVSAKNRVFLYKFE